MTTASLAATSGNGRRGINYPRLLRTALPAISLGFVVPNADRLWRRLRGQPGLGDRAHVAVDRPADDA